jgi:aminopeptidase N
MKRLFWLICSLLILGSFAPAQRLPESARPENYKLTFTPDFDKDKFTGEETIQLQVLKPTSGIVLNSADIEFQETSITGGGSTQTAKVTLDKEKEMATLAVDKPLAAGPATIHIKFTGILNDQLRGFYLGKDEQGRKYAVTQFEATDARRAFPCFDEPAYKATFDVTVVAGKDLAVISNSKQSSDVPGPTPDQHTVRFATTPKMSSYLLAIAVGNFEYVEGSADGIPIRVWTMPGKKNLGNFALDAAEQVMQYYNRYFSIKYPYGKLDMIGLPDFSAGAMENTGFITYREVLLLLDDKQASVNAKKNVSIVIAHEMAHQWFGDLVTMQWWDDIWLNEGFATWMESKPVQGWKPEWHFDLDDVQDTTQSLNTDSLANTRPIRQGASTPAEIQELFDGIAYGKTAAVLRMLESYLGHDTFRAGVNAYLKKHAYANATATDFWSTQAQVSHKPVDKIMPTFVDQPGAPVVAVNLQCSGVSGTANLEQQRFFYDRQKFNEGGNELWQIPICLKEGSANAKNPQQCTVLSSKQAKVPLQHCSNNSVYANAGAAGYYRSSYTPEILQSLSASVEKTLTPAERIMLLSDVWASVRVGRNKIGDYLTLANGMQSDRERAVLEQLTRQLDYIGDYLVQDADRQSYESWLKALLKPAAQSVGWDPKPGESDEQKTLRRQLLFTLGHTARDPEIQAVARKLADSALENPASVQRELATSALRITAFSGDEAFYNRIMERLKDTKTPEEFYMFLGALSSFSDPKLLQETLDYALSPAVRSQDSLGVIARVMANPAGSKLAWDFVRAHWDEIDKRGPFAGAEMVHATASFCDSGLRDEVKDFFSAHNVPAAQRSLKQSIERINYCVDLKSQQGPQLASWLSQQATNSAGE